MQHKNDSVLEAKKAKVKLPPMYKVLLLNDDYTPMEFVVLVLQKFFGMTRERATQVMLKVHREGKGSAASIHTTWPRPRYSRSRATRASTSIRCSA